MNPHDLTPAELLATVVRVLEAMRVPYAVTGSMASMFYGEMRTTNDVDIVADLRPEQVRDFVARFAVDVFYVSEDAVRSTIAHPAVQHHPRGVWSQGRPRYPAGRPE